MVKISFTGHAEDMLKERKFTKEEIISVISNPHKYSVKEMISNPQ